MFNNLKNTFFSYIALLLHYVAFIKNYIFIRTRRLTPVIPGDEDREDCNLK
jgi:hypothetical protein